MFSEAYLHTIGFEEPATIHKEYMYQQARDREKVVGEEGRGIGMNNRHIWERKE